MTDIGPDFGACIIGILVNILLYGIMFMQSYIYFTTCQRDRLFIKLFVLYLFVADTVNAGLMSSVLYDYLVVHFGDLDYLSIATWTFCADPATTGIISCSVQFFFAWRIKVLSGRIWPSLFIAVCALTSGLGGLGTAIAINWFPAFVQFQKFEVIVILWLAGSALADVMITISLVWNLRKRQTGFPVTDDVINRIIRLTVQTGFLTALVAVIDLILFLASSSDAHLAFNLPLSKLYTNSLMSSLNARSGWQTSDMQVDTPSQQIASDRRTEGGRTLRMNPRVLVNLSAAASSAPAAYEAHAMGARPSQEPSSGASFDDLKDGNMNRSPLSDAGAEFPVFGQPKVRYEEQV